MTSLARDHKLENNLNKSKEQKIENICRGLTLDLKSTIPKPHEDNDCKCLVRFHNCTPHRVVPFWIDFKGLPIKYPDLVRGSSINIDTYVSQLWYFKAKESTSNTNGALSQDSAKKVLAISEEALNLSCNASHYNFHSSQAESNGQPSQNDDSRQNGLSDAIHGANNILICSLCKYILKQYSRMPTKVPCTHFTGEARLSASDVECRSRTNFNSLGTYIYSCSENTHRRNHSKERRNIYLVESFHNLRERCFLTLSNRINQPDIVDLNLPVSVQRDYIQFVTTIRKLNDSGTKMS